MNSRRGDYGVQKNSAEQPGNWYDENPVQMSTGEYFVNISTVVSEFADSTLTSNAKANDIYVNGGGYYNFIVGQMGKDSVTFGGTGGGVWVDYGIGAPKSGAASTYATAFTTSTYNRFDVNKYFANIDYLKIKGTVTGVYFDRTTANTPSKKIATVTVIVTYTDLNGDEQVILLPHINKDATTTNSTNAAKRVWNSHVDAVASMKLWHGKTAGSQLYGNSLTAKYKNLLTDFPEELRPRVIELYRRYKNSPFLNSQLNQTYTAEKLPDWLVV